MKKIIRFVALFVIGFFVFSCGESDEVIPFSEDYLWGKWKNTEALISAGGPHFWISINDGEEIEFFENGTFISNKFNECVTGNYVLEGGTLALEYECAEFTDQSENSEGIITSNLVLKPGFFLLSPTSGPICTEGCQSKYEKINID
jgi:hypothetical protein